MKERSITQFLCEKCAEYKSEDDVTRVRVIVERKNLDVEDDFVIAFVCLACWPVQEDTGNLAEHLLHRFVTTI